MHVQTKFLFRFDKLLGNSDVRLFPCFLSCHVCVCGLLHFFQEYVQLMVVANTLVVAMLALTIALVTGIFVLEVEWGQSKSRILSEGGELI